MKLARGALVLTLLSGSACENPFQPGLPDNRRDPGTVVVTVRDTAGNPVRDAWVYIELPNSVGSTFWEGSPTKSDGTVTHRYIPQGRRTLEVKPPAAFTSDSPRQEIDVVKDRTTHAQFTVRRL